MSEKIEIIKRDDRTNVYHYKEGDAVASMDFEIQQDPVVGDWCVWEVVGEGGGEFYVETREGAIQYALQRCGVIEDGDWTRAPERC